MAKTKSRRIRVGIIGQGRSGYSIHADHLRRDSRYQIVAVVDPLAERRQQAQEEFGAETYANHRKVLGRKDLDLVVNAAPSYLHVPITLEFLEAGHNVLCEKPLARRVADVDRVIEAARKAGRLLAIFQQSRFAPYFEQVRKVIDSGVLGRIVMIKIAWNGFSRRWDWQTLREYDGGNLLNTGPHALDHALQLFGEGMPEVKCVMDRTNTFGDAEDHVKLLMTGNDRPTINTQGLLMRRVFTVQLPGLRHARRPDGQPVGSQLEVLQRGACRQAPAHPRAVAGPPVLQREVELGRKEMDDSQVKGQSLPLHGQAVLHASLCHADR